MKIKNTGNKIVSIGNVIILPGDTADIVGYDKNASLNKLIEMGNLERVKESKGGRRNGKKVDEGTAGTAGTKSETDTDEKNAQETEKSTEANTGENAEENNGSESAPE